MSKSSLLLFFNKKNFLLYTPAFFTFPPSLHPRLPYTPAAPGLF
jgi:hypothetical protein